MSLEWMMTVLLIMVAVYTILGGMLSVLVTDYFQFIVMSIGLIAVTGLIMYEVGWQNLVTTATTTNGQNVVNAVAPKFDKEGNPIEPKPAEEPLGAAAYNPLLNRELGWPFVVFNILLNTAATLTWQTTIARVLAAKNTATGRKVYTRTAFFFICQWLLPGIWGIAALAYFTSGGGVAPEGMQAMDAMPLFLGHFVPVGLMGLLIAAMLAADMSTESAYMLTWASVIYNDLLAPFHKERWSEKTGLLWNRSIVAAIGVFLLVYGLWYKIEGDVWSYLTVTGAIYLSSMSALLISACYLKWTNNWGAIGAIVVGAIFPVSYLVLQQLPATKDFANNTIGPYHSGNAAFAGAFLAMAVGSLMKNWLRPTSTSAVSEVVA
jgi:SSS family solute:Na+ symporter